MSLEACVVTFKEVMRDRPNDLQARPSGKSGPVKNMLHFAEFKIAIIRSMFKAVAAQNPVGKQEFKLAEDDDKSSEVRNSVHMNVLAGQPVHYSLKGTASKVDESAMKLEKL